MSECQVQVLTATQDTPVYIKDTLYIPLYYFSVLSDKVGAHGSGGKKGKECAMTMQESYGSSITIPIVCKYVV